MSLIKKSLRTLNKHKAAYLFILPSFLFFTAFTLYPVIRGFQLSFLRYRVPPKVSTFTGFDNFIEVFSDQNFWMALFNTFYYTLYVVVGCMVVSVTVAVFIFRLSGRFQSFFKSLYYLPGVTSAVILATVWKWMFHPNMGLLNYLISLIGMEPVIWLGMKQTAMPSLIFMEIARGDGAAILLLLAALNSIPRDIFEAAQCDGARSSQIFRKVTLPLLKPIVLYLLVMSTINSLQMFVPVFMLTRGGPEFTTITVAYEIYQNAFVRGLRFDIAAAQGVLLFILTFIISIVYFKLFRDDVTY